MKIVQRVWRQQCRQCRQCRQHFIIHRQLFTQAKRFCFYSMTICTVFFVCTYILLQARWSHLKFKNPSWNRVNVASKRWFGKIPTVLLCSERPGMCPPKTWCQQLESSLHKETLNLKPWTWHEYIISYIFQ